MNRCRPHNRQFPASLLPGFKPAAQPALEEGRYNRAKSKPIKDLFPNSSPSIEYFTQYKEKLALSIARQVAHDLLDAPDFTPGDYKLIFRPEGAGTASFIFESLRHTDIMGIKLIKGKHNGEEVRVAEMRYKKKASVAQKGVELELGAPHIRAVMSADTYSDALSDLEAAMKDGSVSARKKEKLAPMLSALEAEKHGQERMMLEACGRDMARLEKAKGIIARIGEEAAALEKAGAFIANAEESDERKMSVKSHAGAIGLCPFGQGSAQAKLFFGSLSAGSQELLGRISKSCLADVIPRVYGVAILEHTALDSISQLQSLLRLLHSRTEPSAERPLLDAIAEFDSRFVSIHGIIGGSAREQAELAAQGAGYGPERWFLKFCSAVNSRKKLLHEFQGLERAANRLASKAGRHQAKKIIANMAFNLCRMDADEAGLLESFANHPSVRKDMKAWRSKEYRKTPLKGMQPALDGFLKAAADEAKRAGAFLGREAEADANGHDASNTSRYRFKDEKKRIDERMHSLLAELRAAAPALGDILTGYFRRSKMHVGYKQLEMLPKSPQNALTRLAIAQRLYEMEADPARKEEYAKRLEGYLGEAAALFALFWSSHGSRKGIFWATKPTRYLQEKGFDMVGDPEKCISTGNTTGKLEVGYKVEQLEGKNSMVFTFNGARHAIGLDFGQIYEAGCLPLDFGASEKEIHEDIFGRRITLGDVMPMLGAKGPQAVFYDLYRMAARDPGKFEEIRAGMTGMEMGNARFLSTIGISRNRHSGCVAKFGGTVAENLPLKYDGQAPNTLSLLISQRYPRAQDDGADARNFAYQQMAKRAVGALTVNKSRIAREYIRSVLAEDG